MTAPLVFLDRLDGWLGRGAGVMTATRELCLGDRRVTGAGDASRIPQEEVRAHVAAVAWDVARDRVRGPLAELLAEHLAEVRAEHELMEGPEPPEPADGGGTFVRDQWHERLASAYAESFVGGDVGEVIVSDIDDLRATLIGGAEALADALLEMPERPDAALERMGATPSAIAALVCEIRQVPARLRTASDGTVVVELSEFVKTGASEGFVDRRYYVPDSWSREALAAWVYAQQMPPDVAEEAVGYVLRETDPDLVRTGAELLGLAGDAAFLEWAAERAAFSTPEQDAADAARVMRLATEGGDGTDVRPDQDRDSTPETAAGGDEGASPAAQIRNDLDTQGAQDLPPREALEPYAYDANQAALDLVVAQRPQSWKIGVEILVVEDEQEAIATRGTSREWSAAKLVVTKTGKVLKDVQSQKLKPSDPSDLTRAVGAALAVLFDHGCESDRAMAGALGVDASVVRGARKGTTPWLPDTEQLEALRKMLGGPLHALHAAWEALKEYGQDVVR